MQKGLQLRSFRRAFSDSYSPGFSRGNVKSSRTYEDRTISPGPFSSAGIVFCPSLPPQLTQEIFLLWSDTPTRPVSWGTSGECDNGVSGEVGVGSGKSPVLRDLDLVPVSSFPGVRAPSMIESLVLASRSNRGIQAHKNAV